MLRIILNFCIIIVQVIEKDGNHTGSPGSLPPRILKPKPVSFLHRNMSCSWKSGTVEMKKVHLGFLH